jgi:hypothetical protein
MMYKKRSANIDFYDKVCGLEDSHIYLPLQEFSAQKKISGELPTNVRPSAFFIALILCLLAIRS